MRFLFACLIILAAFPFSKRVPQQSWIRINQLGYKPGGVKVAVWCSKKAETIDRFQVVDAVTSKVVYEGKVGKALGAYGPFAQTCRLTFSAFTKPGTYRLRAGAVESPVVCIDENVYRGTADFCL